MYCRNSSGFQTWQGPYCVRCYTKSWPCPSSSEDAFCTVSPLRAVGILAGLELKICLSPFRSFKKKKKHHQTRKGESSLYGHGCKQYLKVIWARTEQLDPCHDPIWRLAPSNRSELSRSSPAFLNLCVLISWVLVCFQKEQGLCFICHIHMHECVCISVSVYVSLSPF